MSFDGRIGIAFHRVLESLTRQPMGMHSPPAVAEGVQRRFEEELRLQEARADDRPRERGLPRDRSRAARALEALIVAAQGLARAGRMARGADPAGARQAETPPAEDRGDRGDGRVAVEVEVAVASRDGLLNGRIDRVDNLPAGVRLVDYKSSLRDDLPERYERQVQLYALMWEQTRGSWPVETAVVYPLAGTTHTVPVEPDVCRRVGEESASIIARLQGETSAYNLAAPGDVCKVCEFRPWCRPFWEWQGQERVNSVAVERAYWGFEGTIRSIEVVERHWKVTLDWRGAIVAIVAPVERFPQLRHAQVGSRVRALEMQLRGLRHQPRARVTERSELFLLTGSAR